ncbi:MAG: pyridoxal-phosphate dependent enzyme [Verrucomicrobia bacterium]|jgi:threonine dehydratase|nr:pyridoxal-phosphate dependent enzyme [Verrucomicrobiota bacterium]
MKDTSVTLDSIQQAAGRLRNVSHVTPVLTSQFLNNRSGNTVFLKAEHLQRVGAFKFRGAQNALSQLSNEELKTGVATQSSGNHAQALALAASLKNVPAYIVMPENAPTPKIAAVRGYGAEITFCQPIIQERERRLATIQKTTGATYIPPYNHPSIISGQGTIGLELLEQISDLEVVIAPVGGGGLLSGVATAIKAHNPKIQVYGAEPTGADDAARSLRAGKLIPQEAPNTIADGLLTSLGTHTWPLIQRFVDAIITVNDAQTVEAMRLIWERTKQLIEPSAAVAVAALLSNEFKREFTGSHVAVILSGGNTDLEALPWQKKN